MNAASRKIRATYLVLGLLITLPTALIIGVTRPSGTNTVTSFVCRILVFDGLRAIRSGADPDADNYSAA